MSFISGPLRQSSGSVSLTDSPGLTTRSTSSAGLTSSSQTPVASPANIVRASSTGTLQGQGQGQSPASSGGSSPAASVQPSPRALKTSREGGGRSSGSSSNLRPSVGFLTFELIKATGIKKPRGFGKKNYNYHADLIPSVGVKAISEHVSTSNSAGPEPTWNSVFKFEAYEFQIALKITVFKESSKDKDKKGTKPKRREVAKTDIKINLIKLRHSSRLNPEHSAQPRQMTIKKGKTELLTFHFALGFSEPVHEWSGFEKFILQEIPRTAFATLPEYRDVAAALVSIYFGADSLWDLIKTCIRLEVERVGKDYTVLLRDTTMSVTIISESVKILGGNFLQPILTSLSHHWMPPDDLLTLNQDTQLGLLKIPDLEIDPNKAKDLATAKANQQILSEEVQKLFDTIESSVLWLDDMVVLLCQHLAELVNEKCGKGAYEGIGGILFLRWICPALLSIKDCPPKFHRFFILSVKLLQQLANRVDFEKEGYMQDLNTFIHKNMPKLDAFYDTILKKKVSQVPATGRLVPADSYIAVLRYMNDNKAKLIEQMKSLQAPDSMIEQFNEFIPMLPERVIDEDIF